jgi:hypothetical protein
VTDDPAAGDERERPVRIVLTSAQTATLAHRLLAVIDEMQARVAARCPNPR